MSVGVVNKQTGDRIPTAGMPAIDDALDLTSVNPVQNDIITAALANKQNATDNSLQTTDKTVVGAVNELKSGLINVADDVKLNTQDLTTPSRTKNLIPTTLDILKTANTSGTWSGNAYTAGEVTYTVNTDSDGHVTSIGYSNSSTVSKNQLLIIPMPKDGNNYLFNGGISGDCFIFIWDKTANARAKKWDGTTNSDNATSSVFKEVKNVANHDLQMLLRVSSGVMAGSGTLYPMLCKSTETDTAYAPYIPSVDARLNAVESGLTYVQSGLINYENQNDLNLEVPYRKNVLENTANSATVSGVLYTVNNDGSVSVSTETQSSNISSLQINDFTLPAGEYVLNGCPSGGGSNKYELQIAIGGATYRDYGGGGVSFTSTNQRCVVQILIRSGVTINDTFYPMIRPATITDPTFAPYIPSVDARLDAVENRTKTDTFSGTTDAYGNINLNNYRYVLTANAGGYICIPFEYNYNRYIKVLSTTTFEQVANTNVSGAYTYIDN